MGAVSLRSSAKEMSRGAGSAELPDVPRPAAQRAPERLRMRKAVAAVCMQSAGGIRACPGSGGGREPPPSLVSRAVRLLLPLLQGWRLVRSTRDVAC